MRSQAPGAEDQLVFARLQFMALGLLTLAFIVWQLQDFAASFAASERTAHTTLRTTMERDDARVQQAFEEARSSLRMQASLQTEASPDQQTRDAVLTVVAATKPATLERLEQMVQTMQLVFRERGGDTLFDVGSAPDARPVPNAAYLIVKRGFRFAALAVLLFALTKLALDWKRSNLPRAALFGIIATLLTLAIYMLGPDASSVWFFLIFAGPPLAVLLLIFVVTRRVRRAKSWTEGKAQIITSKVRVERHRFAGDTTKVRNLPCVEYEFEVPGHGKIRGQAISLGYGTADDVHVVLQRYPVGATVPVYFDARNPGANVLERDAPLSPGCLWGIGFGFALTYLTAGLSLLKITSINRAMATALPRLHHPVPVLITGALGLLALAAGLWNWLHPRKAFPWSRTKGSIVSSTTEAFQEMDSSDSQRTHTYYRPVIEFSYSVEGQDYHGSNGSSAITLSAGRKWADAEVARYPVGMEVDVFYDPQKPTQSGLNVNTDLTLNGRASLIVAAILLGVACYAAGH